MTMKLDPKLELYRIHAGPYGTRPGETIGAFHNVPGPCGSPLTILFDDGRDPSHLLGGWEHASVSKPHGKLPNWQEMCFVKALLWDLEECVVQYHPPKADHTSNVANVLHLWRWIRGEFPRPPSLLVGLKDRGEIKSPEQYREMRIET